MRTFVNFSNHNSKGWSKSQIDEAEKYGTIIDVDFPRVPADADENAIRDLGNEYIEKICAFLPDAVMCQGEFTLTFYVVNELMKRDIVCVSACTERISKEQLMEDGAVNKIAEFKFAGFRKFIQ